VYPYTQGEMTKQYVFYRINISPHSVDLLSSSDFFSQNLHLSINVQPSEAIPQQKFNILYNV